jgi:hypothetical protein
MNSFYLSDRERERDRSGDEFEEEFDDGPYRCDLPSGRKPDLDGKKLEEFRKTEDDLRQRDDELMEKEGKLSKRDSDVLKRENDMEDGETDSIDKSGNNDDNNTGDSDVDTDGNASEVPDEGGSTESSDSNIIYANDVITRILRSTTKYRQILKMKGEEAEILLDILQKVRVQITKCLIGY